MKTIYVAIIFSATASLLPNVGAADQAGSSLPLGRSASQQQAMPPLGGTAAAKAAAEACPERAHALRGHPVACEAPPTRAQMLLNRPAPGAQTVGVDLRNYYAVAISSGNSGSMLCDPLEDNVSPNPSCLTSFYDGGTNSEVEVVNANGVINYTAITSEKNDPFGEGPMNYIGTIRNYAADGEPLRCFTKALDPPISCTAPASGHLFGAPYLIQRLPFVPWSTAQATEFDPNPTKGDAVATGPIPGSLITTPSAGDGVAPPNFWNYTVNDFGPQCGQKKAFNTYSLGRIIYVSGVPFGGNVGTRDAIVSDGYSNDSPSVLERSYYVAGFGVVRESVSYKYSGQSKYGPMPNDKNTNRNITRNSVRPYNASVIYSHGNHGGCPQGSALPIRSS